MSARLKEIAERRAILVSHAAAQREQVAYYWTYLTGPVHRVQDSVSFLRRYKWPFLLVSASVFLSKRARKLIAKVPKALWSSWLTLRLIKGFLK